MDRSTHLQEKLVPASMEELNNAMNVDLKLKTFLNTKAKDLPEEYLHLVKEFFKDYKDKTLLDLIQISLIWRIRGTQVTRLFSKSGDKLTGFAAYMVRKNEVIEIEFFSFDPARHSTVLIQDLKEVLVSLLQQYKKVSWTAVVENKANSIYQKVIEEFGGTSEIKNEIVEYCVEKSS